MKHILNDLSNEEKNSIREQHTGGMTVMTESFSKLLNAKLGDAKPLVSEAEEDDADVVVNVDDVSSEDMKCFRDASTEEAKAVAKAALSAISPEQAKQLALAEFTN